jgi:hypothetical protein
MMREKGEEVSRRKRRNKVKDLQEIKRKCRSARLREK